TIPRHFRSSSRVNVNLAATLWLMPSPTHALKDLPLRAFFVLRDQGLRAFVRKSITNLRDLITPPTYGRWISRYDTLTKRARRGICSDIERWPGRPLISVIMPVYNTDLRWLDIAIRSVQVQLYPDWELCICDDASTLEGVRDML